MIQLSERLLGTPGAAAAAMAACVSGNTLPDLLGALPRGVRAILDREADLVVLGDDHDPESAGIVVEV